MGNIHGKNGKVKVGAGAGALVASTTRWSVNETVPVADTTAQGDTAQTHLVGIPAWSGRIEGNYDPADTTGQGALTIGASIQVKLYPGGDAAGAKYYSGTASITGKSREVPMGDKVSFSIDVTGNGALTEATAT